MKKIYLTLFLLLFSTSAFAFDVCEHEKKYSQIWYVNNCDGKKLVINKEKKKETTKKESKKSKLYTSTSKNELPEWANPTDKVLKYYAKKYSKHSKTRKGFKFKIKASENFRKFNFNLRTDDYVNQQLKDTALLSYLVFENDTIVQDEITPEDRFGKYFKNDTKWQSMSMGKSIISYIAGHAICRGYISGINETLDWDIFDKTLYERQKLINVLNMSSGSKEYKDVQGFKNSKRWVNNPTTQSVMKKELKNSKAGDIRYNYSNMDTNVVASYVLYKMGQDNFVKLLNEIFVNKVGIEHDIFLFKQEDAKKKTPSLTYAFYITRYDFLRIAVTILEDWESNTCEGKYLKSLWEKRVNKEQMYRNDYDGFTNPKHYGGQFHMGISGKRDTPIFIMDGFGGQTININFEDKKIISTLSVHRNYNWMKLVHEKL
jgi:hypothetical protein